MYRVTHLVVPALAGFFILSAQAQVLTVQVGSPAPSPTLLVEHTNIWRWHKGTNAPGVGWQTNSDASLGSTWGSGPGGFGYSTDTANETNQCRTVLFDMSGTSATNYSTFYIRRTFEISNTVDVTAHIQLTIDYDDAFVAYLDGVEVARSPNISGAVGTEPAFTALATSTHESSRGTSNPVNPPANYDLGPVGTRTGSHVLAIMGLNQNKSTSSDFILIASVSLVGGQGGGVANNGIYALANTNNVLLTGTNTVPGSARVAINGDDASYNAAQGTWTKAQSLTPGWNRLFIAALDANGNILSNLTQDIVYEVVATNVSGTLAAGAAWTNVSEVVHVTGNVTVPASATLTIGPGVVVIVSPGVSILTSAGGVIDVQGTDALKAFFVPATSNVWNEIAAVGAGSSLTLRHADVNRGAVKFRNGATGLMEDTYVHEYKSGTTPIAGCTSASAVTVRRCHFNIYHETLWQNTPITVEDCLFENADNASSDALDYDGAPPGSVIRRSTFRFGPQSNTDAIDIGPFTNGAGSTNTLIESCLMHDFPNDKGVSIGEGSYGITIRNCLIYRTESGVGVKDSPATPTNKPPCTANIFNTTIANCEYGIRCYNKSDPAALTDGGHVTNSFNNILWNNITNIGLFNGGTVVADYSNIGGTNWPGTGNIDTDPLFVNAAAGDYRLQPGSPCIGTGVSGTNMGVTLPVGGIPSEPLRLAAITAGTNFVTLVWRDSADNEDGFLIERSTDAMAWVPIASAAPNQTNFTDTVGAIGEKYYYRVRAFNDVGVSPFSNIASGARQAPVIFAGGTIAVNTVWPMGTTVIVTSSVTVAAGTTLTIQPCVQMLFNQSASLTVNGLLLAEGTPGCRILFGLNPGATSWGGINLAGSGSTHRIAYADLDDVSGNNIDINGTAAYLQNLWWTNTTSQLINCVGSSLTLLDSYIPGGFGNEPVHFSNMPANGYALIKGNVFGAPQGYNDSVDFTGGNRPGPIVQFIDNVFLAAVDDCFDMDGTDAHIEGNIFMHVHQDAVRASTANAVSTGADAGNQSELVVVRNIFYDCDHALLLKDLGSCVFENNTVVTIETNQFAASRAAYVQFGEPHRSVPGGRGILMNGNILWDIHSTTPFIVFTNTTMFMVANDNIIQGTNMTFGGNSMNDPMFVNWQTGITYQNIKSNLALLPGSPAIGTGPNGLNRGALVPSGASVSGPSGATTNTSATLTVAGPGIYAYRWKLNNGPWSGEVSLTNNFLITATLFSNAAPITLSSLSNGTYTVYVVGKNSAGFWQDTNSPTVSKTWTVSPTAGPTDTDSDGLPDDWEMANGLNKDDPADAGLDPDGDGMTNVQEYFAGTNPQDAASRLWLQISLPSANAATLEFTAISNKSYTLQYRTAVSTGLWLRAQDVLPAGTNRTITVTNNSVDMSRFYRLVTPRAP